MVRIGLIVDNPSRDLKGLLLVARQLAARGHDAFLIPMYSQGVDVPLLGLDAVVVNYARDVNRGLLETYRRLGLHVAVLDTEGGIVSKDGADSPENWASRMKNEGFNELIDSHFFWGREIKTAFEKFSGIRADRLFVTGCPRYDFTAKKWRAYFEYPHHGFVLLNTNFSAINPVFSQSEEQEVQAFLKSGWERGYVEALLKDWKVAMERMMETFERMFRARPDTTFVLRPHPFENAEFYRNRFRKFSNLKVVTEGDVFQAIAHATCIVHLNCGTAIESLLMETLPINVEFANTPMQREHTPLPRVLSVNPTSFEELLQMIDAPAGRSSELAEKIETYITPWFGPVDGQASVRVAEILDQVVKAKRSTRSLKDSILSGRRPGTAGAVLQGLGANIIGSYALTKLRELSQPVRKMKSFDADRVNRELEKYVHYDPLENSKNVSATVAHHPYTWAPLSSIKISAV